MEILSLYYGFINMLFLRILIYISNIYSFFIIGMYKIFKWCILFYRNNNMVYLWNNYMVCVWKINWLCLYGICKCYDYIVGLFICYIYEMGIGYN